MYGDENPLNSQHAYSSATAYSLADEFKEDSAMYIDAENSTPIRSRFGSPPLQNIGGSEENPEQDNRGIPVQPNECTYPWEFSPSRISHVKSRAKPKCLFSTSTNTRNGRTRI